MSWVCPNCSSSNDDEQISCFVCGMEKPIGTIRSSYDSYIEPERESYSDSYSDSDSDTDDIKIFFSDFEAFKESIKRFFKKRPKRIGIEEREDVAEIEEISETEDMSDADFAGPWPEHAIIFDTEAIKAKGYVRSEQQSLGGVNGYYFYREDGSGQFIRLEMLLVQKMAHKA